MEVCMCTHDQENKAVEISNVNENNSTRLKKRKLFFKEMNFKRKVACLQQLSFPAHYTILPRIFFGMFLVSTI